MIRAVNYALFYSSLSLINFVTFSTYAGLGNDLTPKRVFTAIALFTYIRLYCIQFFVLGLLSVSEVTVAIKRIEV